MMPERRVIPSLVLSVNFHEITETEEVGPHTQRLPSILSDGVSQGTTWGLLLPGWLAGWLAG